jgi:hypothetical protein
MFSVSASTFQKAFHTVGHAVIVDKLIKLSPPGDVINWLISFLTDRQIVLKFYSVLLQPEVINLSIVQESGVGLAMCIVHESDLQLISHINILIK